MTEECLVSLVWLADPDAVTIRIEGTRLVVCSGPFDGMESAFECEPDEGNRSAE